MRTSTSSFSFQPKENAIHYNTEATSVQYHPSMEHIFVVSDAGGSVCLRDARMGFSGTPGRTSGGVVQTVRSSSK